MSTEDASILLLRFNRLMRDLRTGMPSRNSYRPWEVELLVDLDSCELPSSDRERLLDRYQRAVRRRLESGAAPLKLSEYLAGLPSERAQNGIHHYGKPLPGNRSGAARHPAPPE